MKPSEKVLIFSVIMLIIILSLQMIATNNIEQGPKHNTTNSTATGKSNTINVTLTVTVNHAPESIVEEIIAAQREMLSRGNVFIPSEILRKNISLLLGEGWQVIQVEATLYNMENWEVVLGTGGPYCGGLGVGAEKPLDDFPSVNASRGEAIPLIYVCQQAYVIVHIPPGSSYSTTYYYLVSPDFQGTITFNVELYKGDPADENSERFNLVFTEHISALGD